MKTQAAPRATNFEKLRAASFVTIDAVDRGDEEKARKFATLAATIARRLA